MIALRAKTQDRRYRSAVGVLLVVLGLLVVWEHTGSEHGHVEEVVSMCMAVLSGTVAVIGVGAQPRRVRWSTLVLMARPHISPRAAMPLARARAGPTRVQVLLR